MTTPRVVVGYQRFMGSWRWR